MIDVIVTLQIKADMQAKAKGLLRQLKSEAVENDAGCLRYQWYRAEQPGTYYLLERWTNQAAMEAHFKAAGHGAALAPVGLSALLTMKVAFARRPTQSP